MGRSNHATVYLDYGGDRPQLVVTGGLDASDNVLNDVWIMDVQSGMWKEVSTCIYGMSCVVNQITNVIFSLLN